MNRGSKLRPMPSRDFPTKANCKLIFVFHPPSHFYSSRFGLRKRSARRRRAASSAWASDFFYWVPWSRQGRPAEVPSHKVGGNLFSSISRSVGRKSTSTTCPHQLAYLHLWQRRESPRWRKRTGVNSFPTCLCLNLEPCRFVLGNYHSTPLYWPCFTNFYRTNSMPEKPPQKKIAIPRADKRPIKMNVKKLFERDVLMHRSEGHASERQEVR